MQHIMFLVLISTLVFTSSCKSIKAQRWQQSDVVQNEKIVPDGREIVNTKNSPHVSLKSIDIGDCHWTDGFWAEKFALAEKSMVPYMGELLTGDIGHSLNNFKIAAGLKEGSHKGMHWHDGDFYKWIEAAMYVYAINKNQALLDELNSYIEIIAQAQKDDGYLSTQITTNEKLARWANRKYHELYNSGHLLTSACIHHRVTGQTNFLSVAIKHADYLYQLFQPQPKKLSRFGFNQTQIIGLVDMYRTTRNKNYLELAEIFINNRGKSKVAPDETVRYRMVGDMTQERTPLREETEAVGHAVLALYYYVGAADVYAETGEQALIDALDRLWESVVHKKMYLTGAVGQVHHGASSQSDGNTDFVHEAFIDDYVMPNASAYNETCANVCNSMFSYRMLGIHGQAKYADVIETVLFNSALSGIALDGKHYFYTNPLRMCQNTRDYSQLSTESAARTPYIKCFCCPPNLVRTITKLSGWAYSLSQNGISVNMYGGNQLNTNLLDGSKISLTQKTLYPWDGAIELTIQECKSEAFDIMLRIPEWAKSSSIMVNGEMQFAPLKPAEFVTMNREWKAGDKIMLNLDMNIELVEGHPRIEELRNQVAVKRGPIVYCIESPDLPENTDILDVYISGDTHLEATYKPNLLGGVTSIDTEILIRQDEAEGMYRTIEKPTFKKYKTSFIPYYAWSNREISDMTVFLPVLWNAPNEE